VNSKLRRISSVVVGLVLVGAGALLQPFGEDAARSNRDSSLQGTWRVEITPRNCQTGARMPPFFFLLSFAQDGTLTEVMNAPAFLPGQRSIGLGVWSHTRGNTYKIVSEAFILFDSPTTPGFTRGRQRLKWDITVDGDQAAIDATSQFLDINGNVLANTYANGTGTRFEDLRGQED
jgi:hypothetical protein